MKTKFNWDKVMNEVASGTRNIFVAADGRVGLDGYGMTIPERFLHLIPEAAMHAAVEKQAAIKRVADSRISELVKTLNERDATINLRLDEPGFALIAGENSAMVHRGTLRECRDNLWKVMTQPCDSYVGKGCWVIVDSENRQIEMGEFDKHAWW